MSQSPPTNAATDRLVPLVQAHIQATGQCPVVVSADDGHSSTPNLEALAEICRENQDLAVKVKSPGERHRTRD